jgi:hypothetical protein
MVDVTVKFPSSAEQIKQRIGRIKVPAARPGIRVEPRDADMRRLLKHPNGARFRPEGSIEWPDDQFTHRRIRDGSVKVVEPPHDEPPEKAGDEQPEHEQPEPQPQRRQLRRHEQE